jgi:GntP family gluconate:H+ symporter
MLLSLSFIVIAIIFIILITSYLKIHPFLALLFSSVLLAFLIEIPAKEIPLIIASGFGKVIQNIGLLIIYGSIIGAALEKSNATISLAKGILKYLNKLPLPYAVSCIGYLVSIPVFCDAAFVILSQLNKTLSLKTKTPLVGLTVALSTGLFAPHVLVPPTPGPLAAAANLSLENISLLILTGAVVAFILILVGATYSNYLSKIYPYQEPKTIIKKKALEDKKTPSFIRSIAPIVVPIILMCIGTLFNKTIFFTNYEGIILFLTIPSNALLIGMILSFMLVKKDYVSFLNLSITKGISQAAPIIIITGMGGALGAVIQEVPLQSYVEELSSSNSLGLVIPFIIAAILKTAQGSSTVSIITTSSIVFPLLASMGLDSEMGKVWVIMAIGTGSMTVSHANDSYFWIVSQMGGIDVKTAYKTHTFATLIQGIVGLIIILLCYNIWVLI